MNPPPTTPETRAIQDMNALFILAPMFLEALLVWGNILLYPPTTNHGGSQ